MGSVSRGLEQWLVHSQCSLNAVERPIRIPGAAMSGPLGAWRTRDLTERSPQAQQRGNHSPPPHRQGNRGSDPGGHLPQGPRLGNALLAECVSAFLHLWRFLSCLSVPVNALVSPPGSLALWLQPSLPPRCPCLLPFLKALSPSSSQNGCRCPSQRSGRGRQWRAVPGPICTQTHERQRGVVLSQAHSPRFLSPRFQKRTPGWEGWGQREKAERRFWKVGKRQGGAAEQKPLLAAQQASCPPPPPLPSPHSWSPAPGRRGPGQRPEWKLWVETTRLRT